jgi:hypothetical protein
MRKSVSVIVGVYILACFKLTAGLVWAETIAVQPVPTENVVLTQTPTNQERIEVTKEKNGATVTFYNSKNEIVKKIELNGQVEKGYQIYNGGETYFLKNPKSHGIVITYVNREKQPQEVLYNTGQIYKYKNNIEFYNSNGDLLFKQINANYLPVRISTSGIFLVCYTVQAFRDDLYNYNVCEDVLDNPPHGIFYVFDRSGSLVFQLNQTVAEDSVDFSDDDKWMLFRSGKYVLINTNTMKTEAEFSIDRMYHQSMERLFNNGEMMWLKDIEPRKNVYITTIYNPFKNEEKKLGVLTSDEIDAWIKNNEASEK